LRLTSPGRLHLCWSVGNVGTRVCLPALGAEGSLLAGGSPYSALAAPNSWRKKMIEDANVTLHIELTQGSSMSLPIESMHNCTCTYKLDGIQTHPA
jgi:hypothetical protein